MLTYDAAIDEMSAQYLQAWQAGSGAIVGYVPEIRWPGVENAVKPATDKFWARFSTQGVGNPQTSLSNCVEGADDLPASRFSPYGLIFVQLFAPKSLAEGMVKGRLLAHLTKLAYQGKKTSGGIWFRNVRINELPDTEELWYRFNIVAEYEYDEVAKVN